jgi:hypothetical protein
MANSGLMQCSKKDRYSITSLARSSRFSGTATPKRLSSLEVDHQLEHSRLHDWQIGWLRTLEDAPCIDADLAIIFTDTRAVTYQTASPHEVRKRVDPRYRIACGQVSKLVPPSDEVSVSAHDESINAPFTDGHERRVNLSLTACRYSQDLHPDRRPADSISAIWASAPGKVGLMTMATARARGKRSRVNASP